LENIKGYTRCLPSRKVTSLVTRPWTAGGKSIMDYKKEDRMWSPKTPVLSQPFTHCVNLAWYSSHFGTSFLIFKVNLKYHTFYKDFFKDYILDTHTAYP